MTASWWKILLLVFGTFRIRRFRAYLIFWKGLQSVKKFPHLLQPIRIKNPDLPDDLFSIHLFFLSASDLLLFVRALIISKEALL